MTAQEAVAEFGIPSTRTLRTMRARGLPAVKLGKAHLFHSEDIEAFIQNAKVVTSPRPPQEEAERKTQAAASALATAKRLKEMGRKTRSSIPDADPDVPRTKPYTVAALADHWGTSTTAIYNLINARLLPAFKLGGKLIRIKPEAVEEYERRKAGQVSP